MIAALSEIEDSAVVTGLIEALRDPQAKFSGRAARALGLKNDPQSLTALIAALRDHPCHLVRQEAVWALRWRKDRAGVPGLSEALRDTETDIRMYAAEVLAELPDSVAVPRLLAALHDPDECVRGRSAYPLGKIKDPGSVAGLLAALRQESDDEVRRSICWALGELNVAAVAAAQAAAATVTLLREKVLPVLRTVREGDRSVMVRLQADQAIQGLGLESGVEPDAVVAASADLPVVNDKMRTEAATSRKQLDTFCLIGEVLRDDKIETFTIGWMAQQLRQRYNLPIGASTIGDHLDKVENIFGKHFPGLGVLLDRGQGQRPAITPQWWRAWRIAMQVLGRQPVENWAKRWQGLDR